MYNEENDITPEEQEAFMEWWDAHIPKNFVTILNPAEYANAVSTIKKVVLTIRSCCEDEDEMPEFEVKYDSLFATRLSLKVRITEFGLKMLASQAADVVNLLPADCVIDMLPLNDNRVLIDLTFRNIKGVIAHSEAEDLPDDL